MKLLLAVALALVVPASVPHPRGLALLPGSAYLVAEPFAALVQRVDATGAITTVAGNGTAGFSGDGGPATLAQLNLPHGVATLPDGSFLIVDTGNHRVRRVDTAGTIATAVGTGQAGYTGDGIPATLANLHSPRGIAAYPDGSYLIADTDSNRVRHVGTDGIITTVAGPEGLNLPYAVATSPGGGLLVVDYGSGRVLRYDTGGKSSVVAQGLVHPHAVAALADGGVLIAETGRNRILRVSRAGQTVVGSGYLEPKAVTVLPGGRAILVADSGHDVVQVVALPLELRLVTLARTRIVYTSSGVTPVKLVISRAGRAVLERRLQAQPGTNAATLPRLAAGVYDVALGRFRTRVRLR